MNEQDQTILLWYLEIAKPIDAYVVERLVALVDPNAKDVNGTTALHYAAIRYNTPYRVFKCLLEAGADPNAVNSFG